MVREQRHAGREEERAKDPARQIDGQPTRGQAREDPEQHHERGDEIRGPEEPGPGFSRAFAHRQN